MKRVIVFALTAIMAGSAPSAYAQNREHQQMAADVRMLQEQTQQLATAVAAFNQALAESLKAINARLDQASDASRKAFADQKILIDSIEDGVRVIRERSNDTNVRIGELREELEALRSTVQALQQAATVPPPFVDPSAPVDPNAPPVTTAPQVTVPPAAQPPPASSTAGLSPTRLYETARADYFAGQWTSAINGFEAFLRAFPRSEQADDAQFHIGETHYAQNQWARGDCRIQSGHSELRRDQCRARRVLQARPGAGTARTGRRGPRLMGGCGQELSRQRRRTTGEAEH